LVSISALFGTVTIGDQVLIIKDFGLMAISLFSVGFVVFSAAALLAKELNRKTIFNVLSKPVSRLEFILGKYLGMLGTTVTMVFIMGACLSGVCFLLESSWDTQLLFAYLYAGLEISIVCAITILFSTILVTPILAGLISFGVFLAGRNIEYVSLFLPAEKAGDIHPIALILQTLLPRLDRLNLANDLVYGASISGAHILWGLAYAVAYSVATIVLASLFFKRREFN
jgi:ABC-type transport system involved in multi-copper enzyme maturation permease subunit